MSEVLISQIHLHQIRIQWRPNKQLPRKYCPLILQDRWIIDFNLIVNQWSSIFQAPIFQPPISLRKLFVTRSLPLSEGGSLFNTLEWVSALRLCVISANSSDFYHALLHQSIFKPQISRSIRLEPHRICAQSIWILLLLVNSPLVFALP